MRFVLGFALLLTTACRSNGPADPQPITIAGTYPTTVTVGENTCGQVTTQNMPTTVTLSSDPSRFTMAHAGVTYTGTLNTDNTFTTQPVELDANGTHYTIRITGRFLTNRLEADVRLDVTRPTGGPCYYIVHWVGTK